MTLYARATSWALSTAKRNQGVSDAGMAVESGSKETNRRLLGKLLRDTGQRAFQTRAQWHTVPPDPRLVSVTQVARRTFTHTGSAPWEVVRGSRISTRRYSEQETTAAESGYAHKLHGSRSSGAKRARQPCSELRLRSGARGEGGLEEKGECVRRRGDPCWPRGPCSIAVSSLYARSQAWRAMLASQELSTSFVSLSLAQTLIG